MEDDIHFVLPVKTSRLILRHFSSEDTSGLHDIYREPEISRYLLSEPMDHNDAVDATLRRCENRALDNDGDSFSVAVEERSTGSLVGDFSLRLVNKDLGRLEIGFILSSDHMGMGYAREAGNALMSLAFSNETVRRIVGHCNAKNHSSQNLMRSLEMRKEAHYVKADKLKGEFVDTMLFAILRDEFKDH